MRLLEVIDKATIETWVARSNASEHEPVETQGRVDEAAEVGSDLIFLEVRDWTFDHDLERP